MEFQRHLFPTHDDELVIDNFAGGGGASTGISRAIGRSVDVAINHNRDALRMHEMNHPETRHYCEDIREIDPLQVCGDRPVGMVWFSPDCTHHSKAKGGKPRKKEIRGLAWIVLKWAKAVRPRVIFLENVVEWLDWCPLKKGQPRELAKAQGMPDDYILTGNKTQQVKAIGNSVSPPPAEALVRANYKAAKVAAVGATA